MNSDTVICAIEMSRPNVVASTGSARNQHIERDRRHAGHRDQQQQHDLWRSRLPLSVAAPGVAHLRHAFRSDPDSVNRTVAGWLQRTNRDVSACGHADFGMAGSWLMR